MIKYLFAILAVSIIYVPASEAFVNLSSDSILIKNIEYDSFSTYHNKIEVNSFSYPQIKGLKDLDFQNALNQDIFKSIKEKVLNPDTSIIDLDLEVNMALQFSHKVVCRTKNFMSIEMSIYRDYWSRFMSVGETWYYHIDLKNEVLISDINEILNWASIDVRKVNTEILSVIRKNCTYIEIMEDDVPNFTHSSDISESSPYIENDSLCISMFVDPGIGACAGVWSFPIENIKLRGVKPVFAYLFKD